MVNFTDLYSQYDTTVYSQYDTKKKLSHGM